MLRVAPAVMGMIFLASKLTRACCSSSSSSSPSALGNTLGQAIKADVVDYDEYLTGERKEGSYFAVWAFVMKFAGSIMIGIAGLALSWAGYVENVAQTEFVRNTMLWLNGGIPAICFLIGLIAFGRFRLDSAEHARIRRVVAERSP